MKIGIGIDTGGTCTDAVAYDFDSGQLVAKGKSLTTRENLSIGIGKALDQLPQELIRSAVIVSLSTTLATNACLEDKGGRAKLLIFGLTDEVIARFKAEKYGFKLDSVRCIDTKGSADGLQVDEPDWNAVVAEYGDWLADADALSTAEVYAIYNGAPCEKHFKEIVAEKYSLPCTGANELTSELNVLVRGATALLNARLLPVIREFVKAASADFAARGCTAPVMVVRSDGSMMTADFTLSKPVETILSGPAASVLAGRTFTDEEDYVIIDMGGTTTDVSVVRGGKPVPAKGGIDIGGWKTSVRGIFVDPFALGGDSAVRLVNEKPQLFARRVTSLCAAATRWPEIKTKLYKLIEKKHFNKFPLHEFFYLVREPAEQISYTTDELALISVLRNGPCCLEELKNIAGIDLYFFNSDRLEAEGVVMRCGLTPTDFMHIKGDYAEYDAEASELAAGYMLLGMGRKNTPENIRELAEEVYGLVEGRMYENVLRVLLAQQYPAQFRDGIDAQTEFLIREAWARHSANRAVPQHDAAEPVLFNHIFTTKAALVGIGAPTHIFLPEVARALGAKCILPEHAGVANALGALKADVSVYMRVRISQRLDGGNPYYIVHAPTGSVRYNKMNDATDYAQVAAEAAAIEEARRRGITGAITPKTYIEKYSTVSSWGSDVDFGISAVSEVSAGLE